MPDELPVLDAAFWQDWRNLSFQDIGCAVAEAFFSGDVPLPALREIVAGTLTFDAPLVSLSPHDHILELVHGPTLAFKDFGARFMARLMAWLTRGDARELTVLVATSGDTGGAVASAFHNVPGTRVIILYPQGKVSGLQEKQLTALGGNITALEIQGSFDDCQALVKSAFLDRELSERLNLTSANSINLARLVPQSFYYIRAAIREVKALHDYVIDPHGAVGWLAARQWRADHPASTTITLETAHPAKFPDVITAELGPDAIAVPERLAILAGREKVATLLPVDQAVFRDWLLASVV